MTEMVGVAKIILCASFALLVAFVPEPSGASNRHVCGRVISDFVQSPDVDTYTALAHDLECWKRLGESNSRLTSVQRRASMGNRWAVRYVVYDLRNQDGAALEDSFIAIGEFYDLDIGSFLAIVSEAKLSDLNIVRSVTMLSLLHSDDQEWQLRKLRGRLEKLVAIKGNTRSHVRHVAEAGLEAAISEVQQSVDDEKGDGG